MDSKKREAASTADDDDFSELKRAKTRVVLTGPTRQQVLPVDDDLLELLPNQSSEATSTAGNDDLLELKLAQTHVVLTGPTRQQVLQLMMTC